MVFEFHAPAPLGRFFSVCLLGALLVDPNRVVAEPAMSGPGNTSSLPAETVAKLEVAAPMVSFVMIGDPSIFEHMHRITDSRALDRFDVRLQQRDTLDIVEVLAEGRTEGVAVHCFVDLRRASDVRVYFADRGTERFLYRRLALATDDGKLDWETLSQVVELSLLALIENKDLGLTRAEIEGLLSVHRSAPPSEPPPPQPAVPSEPPLPQHWWGFAAAARYRLRSYSDEIRAVHGPAFGFGIERRTQQSTWEFGAEEALGFERSYRGHQAGVDVYGLASLLTIGFRQRLPQNHGQGSFALGARSGIGLEFVHLRPHAGDTNSELELTEPRFITLPIAALSIFGELHLSPNVALELALGSLFDLGQVHFDVEVGQERSVVLERYRVQPTVALGLSFR